MLARIVFLLLGIVGTLAAQTPTTPTLRASLSFPDPLPKLLASGHTQGNIEAILARHGAQPRTQTPATTAISLGALLADAHISLFASSNEDFIRRATDAYSLLLTLSPDIVAPPLPSSILDDHLALYSNFVCWQTNCLAMLDSTARTYALAGAWLQSLRIITRTLPSNPNIICQPRWSEDLTTELKSLPDAPEKRILLNAIQSIRPLISTPIKTDVAVLTSRKIASRTGVAMGLLLGRPNSLLPPISTLPTSLDLTYHPYSNSATRLSANYIKKGYAVSCITPAIFPLLLPGQSHKFILPVNKGLEYAILVCSDDVRADISLAASTETSALPADTRGGRIAGIVFQPDKDGTITVTVSTLDTARKPFPYTLLLGCRP